MFLQATATTPTLHDLRLLARLHALRCCSVVCPAACQHGQCRHMSGLVQSWQHPEVFPGCPSRLTSEVGRDPVHSTRHGSQRGLAGDILPVHNLQRRLCWWVRWRSLRPPTGSSTPTCSFRIARIPFGDHPFKFERYRESRPHPLRPGSRPHPLRLGSRPPSLRSRPPP